MIDLGLDSAGSWIVETWHSTPASARTIVTAAFGAFIGAWLTSRSQEKRRVVEELKALHAAFSLCFSITSRAIALKRLVRPMKERHDRAVDTYEEQQQRQDGLPEVKLDLQILSQLKFPGELLEKIVFEKCSVGPKALASAIALTAAIDDLRHSIEFRNALVSEFREKGDEMTALGNIRIYVGAYAAGLVDNRFRANMMALTTQTDDCIFFSIMLAEELLRYENRLYVRNMFKYRLGMSELLPIDWTAAREEKLIPDEARYPSWTLAFPRRVSTWKRLVAWVNGLFVRTATLAKHRAPPRAEG
jgi:hypothetical protein